MHTLSTRATNIPAPLADDPTKTTMKKAYYLACGFCRWTSRDVGMADKSVGRHLSNFHINGVGILLALGTPQLSVVNLRYDHLSLMFWSILSVAASGGWQEPENPHGQRVSCTLWSLEHS